MKTVYGIMAGDHSNYHVICLTDTKEVAEKIKESVSGQVIEEYYLISSREKIKKIKYYYAQVNIKGQVIYKKAFSLFPWESMWRLSQVSDYNVNTLDTQRFIEGWACIITRSNKNYAHAIKTGRDMLATIKERIEEQKSMKKWLKKKLVKN